MGLITKLSLLVEKLIAFKPDGVAKSGNTLGAGTAAVRRMRTLDGNELVAP